MSLLGISSAGLFFGGDGGKDIIYESPITIDFEDDTLDVVIDSNEIIIEM